ncbi:hypothetical protein XaC1_210 [Xanthomonas phage XaC1]|nr:hypothetical protein XaC1_210 [Xanthomonas phage XaC1]
MKKSIFAVLMVLGLSSCNVEANASWNPRFKIDCINGDDRTRITVYVEDFNFGESVLYFKDKDDKKHWITLSNQCHVSEL